jgi:hypothetical protein
VRNRVREIWPTKHLTLLHAVNLRHGTDGFTSAPKEVQRIHNQDKTLPDSVILIQSSGSFPRCF